MRKGHKSAILFKRAQRVLVGGVNSPVRSFRAVGGNPLFMSCGRGPFLWDADGRRYLDFCLSWGPLILGHARPEVVEAAWRALKDGASFGAPSEREVFLAEAVREAFPSIQKVRFTSSGTEAVMGALRLARAFTGRRRIVKFAGCYHGHWDGLLVQAGSGAVTLGQPDSAGVPAQWVQDTLVVPYNDPQALARVFRDHPGQIACVLVEPIAANMGVAPPERSFLDALQTLPRENGALLVYDEVITGFRVAYGGAQSLQKVRPDLTVLGGGFPVGAFGGRKDVMEMLAPEGPVYQAGTLSGNPVAMAAGLATLKILRQERPYAQLEAAARSLASELEALGRLRGVPLRVNAATGMFTAFFTDQPVRDYESARRARTDRYARFFHALLPKGVYLPPSQFEAAFLSCAHSAAHLEHLLSAADQALQTL